MKHTTETNETGTFSTDTTGLDDAIVPETVELGNDRVRMSSYNGSTKQVGHM
jgi:hypothetical protein